MNFTEFQFWPKLLICLAIISAIRFFLPKQGAAVSLYDRSALAVLSLYLLARVSVLTFGIFVAVFLIAWILVHLLFRVPPTKRNRVLWFGIPLLLLPLIYYKYRVFIAKDILGYADFDLVQLVIPAGISFYTFQMISMLVDASRLNEWKPRFIDYLNFASFFPQVVAGPIERKDSLFPQMENFSFAFSWKHLNNGAPWLALGLFYKLCLSDNLTPFINRDLMASAWPVVITTFLFGLKIYFDFCGYSLIALGLAKCLGVELTLNFRSPYWSANIREFWRRWHISLSYWFRDYIYIPLGGGRTNKWAFNLFVVFALSGLWHGAGWGFILWGALHGIFCIVSHYFHGKFRMPWIAGWVITTICVFVTWLPFYETNAHALLSKAGILCQPSSWAPSALMEYLRIYNTGELATLASAIALSSFAILCEGICRWTKRDDYACAQHPLFISFCIICVILLGGTESNEFIYFSF